MTIRKGEAWGSPGQLPADGEVVASDAAARALVERARAATSPPPVIGLTGGDLWRTLGGVRGDRSRLRSREAMTFPIDVVEATLDGDVNYFVAHLVARSPLWGRAVVAMNAQWLGRWNAGPRAHPNDGLVDVYEARLAVADRMKVRGRLHHGTHLPHPGIRERRTATFEVDLGRSLPVWVDGERIGSARRIELVVEPDALQVVV